MIQYAIIYEVPMKKVFQEAKFHGLCFSIAPCAISGAPGHGHASRNIGTRFDLSKYEEVNTPAYVGLSSSGALPYILGLRVLDLPIKFPTTNYRVPVELKAYEATIQQMINLEEALNPDVSGYHAYLTIDNSVVEADTTQRVPGLHVDGFQGARIPESLPIDHSYICHSCMPTAFYEGPFPVSHLDMTRDNFFHAFDAIAASQRMTPLTFPNYAILFMDAYAVHASTKTTKRCERTFLRLSYSVRQFDRLGNSHNPGFDYNWEMVERDVHLTLGAK